MGGKKEGEGPLGDCFDKVCADDLLGQESWEKAESRCTFTVTVPSNCEALICLPDGSRHTQTAGTTIYTTEG